MHFEDIMGLENKKMGLENEKIKDGSSYLDRLYVVTDQQTSF